MHRRLRLIESGDVQGIGYYSGAVMDLGFGLWQSHFVTTASSIKLLKHSSSTIFPYTIECTYCLVLCKVHQCKISQHITSLCCVCTIVLSESSFGQFLRCFPRLAKAEMVAVRGLCNLRTAFLPSLAMMKMLIKIMSMTLMMMAALAQIPISTFSHGFLCVNMG